MIRRQYRRYNAIGTQHTVRLLPPEYNGDPVGHFIASVNALFEYVLQDVIDSDMVGITIQNQVNQNDKPVGISFRRKDQLSGEVVRSVFEKSHSLTLDLTPWTRLSLQCIRSQCP